MDADMCIYCGFAGTAGSHTLRCPLLTNHLPSPTKGAGIFKLNVTWAERPDPPTETEVDGE